MGERAPRLSRPSGERLQGTDCFRGRVTFESVLPAGYNRLVVGADAGSTGGGHWAEAPAPSLRAGGRGSSFQAGYLSGRTRLCWLVARSLQLPIAGAIINRQAGHTSPPAPSWEPWSPGKTLLSHCKLWWDGVQQAIGDTRTKGVK